MQEFIFGVIFALVCILAYKFLPCFSQPHTPHPKKIDIPKLNFVQSIQASAAREFKDTPRESGDVNQMKQLFAVSNLKYEKPVHQVRLHLRRHLSNACKT